MCDENPEVYEDNILCFLLEKAARPKAKLFWLIK